jgi:amino acid adenylation domain-containing protein
MVGGEAFPGNLFRMVKETYQAKIYNMYGPTETTVWSAVKVRPENGKNSILGKPPGTRFKKERYTGRDIDCAPGGQGALFETFDNSLSGRVGDVVDSRDIGRYPQTNPEPVNKPGDLSYVLYTSGTTGTPKGVMVHHLGMYNHIAAKINDLAVGAEDIIAQTASASFDISVWQFLAGLLTGAAALIIAREMVYDADRWLRELRKRNVTIWESVPSLVSVFLDILKDKSEKERELKDLRWMLLTGEALNPHLVREWYGYYPGIKLLNAYGPTEASDDITHYVVEGVPPESQLTVPIGKPIQNTRIYILDRNLSLCPIGVRGEICTAGLGVGRGYWKDPGKTQNSFVPNPFSSELADPDYAVMYRTGDIGYILENGEIECLGRLDHQVKIRGNRVEL